MNRARFVQEIHFKHNDISILEIKKKIKGIW